MKLWPPAHMGYWVFANGKLGICLCANEVADRLSTFASFQQSCLPPMMKQPSTLTTPPGHHI